MLLSINITSFNRPKLLLECVNSIFNQSVERKNLFEIIIVDDKSSEENIHKIREFLRNYDVNFIENNINKKLSQCRNIAINNSLGEWYSFCDDDDMWPPNMLSKFKEILDNNDFEPDIILFLDDKYKDSWEKLFPSEVRLKDIIIAGVTPPVSSQFYKTEMLKKIGGYNVNIFAGVDHDLWIRLCKSFNPKVQVCWGISSIVCNDLSLSRITTNQEKRIYDIKNSLNIWQSDIVEQFGIDFFKHFEKSYINYLNWKKLVQDFKLKNYIQFSLGLINIYNLKKIFSRIIYGQAKSCNVFPNYKKSKK